MPSKICINKNLLVFIFFFLIVAAMYVYTVNKIASTKVVFQPKAAELKKPPRIVGGTEVTDPKKWPFVVEIFRINPLFSVKDPEAFEICTGTLIAPNWVLTAAHCIKDPDTNFIKTKDDIEIFIGGVDLRSWTKENIYRVKRIILHEHYLDDPPARLEQLVNDIALIELEKPVKESETMKTISLNDDPSLEKEIVNNQNQYGVMLGYGLISRYSPSRNLYQAVVPILSNDRVNKISWLGNTKSAILDTQIAAGYPLGRVGGCHGDSGGPLIVWNGNKWIQVSIASRITEDYCDHSPHHPTIFTRVSSYISWIKSEINKRPKKTGGCYPSCDFTYYTYDGTYSPNQGTFTGTGKELSTADLQEFNCRINNGDLYKYNIGAPYKCGNELLEDDNSPKRVSLLLYK